MWIQIINNTVQWFIISLAEETGIYTDVFNDYLIKDLHLCFYQIGIWSRWLTDQYGLDVEDPAKDWNKQEDNDVAGRQDNDKSLKSFLLLQALSDLMMLPKDMLLSKSIRKEVWA